MRARVKASVNVWLEDRKRRRITETQRLEARTVLNKKAGKLTFYVSATVKFEKPVGAVWICVRSLDAKFTARTPVLGMPSMGIGEPRALPEDTGDVHLIWDDEPALVIVSAL